MIVAIIMAITGGRKYRCRCRQAYGALFVWSWSGLAKLVWYDIIWGGYGYGYGCSGASYSIIYHKKSCVSAYPPIVSLN